MLENSLRQGIQSFCLQIKGGFGGVIGVGNQPSEKIDEEIEGTAMWRMFDLADVFELVIDGLNNGPFAQEYLVDELDEPILHILFCFGDQLQTALIEFLKEGLGDIASVAKQLSPELLGHLGDGTAVVNIRGGEGDGQQLPSVIDNQV
jgi:hypothetical protein